MGTPLGPKYKPYTYMDPLGWSWSNLSWSRGDVVRVYGAGFKLRALFSFKVRRQRQVLGINSCMGCC